MQQLGFFFTCAEQTCEIGVIHQDNKASVSDWVLHSDFLALLRHPEHCHTGISRESSWKRNQRVAAECWWPAMHFYIVLMGRVLVLEYFCPVAVCACKQAQPLRECMGCAWDRITHIIWAVPLVPLTSYVDVAGAELSRSHWELL